MAGDENQYRFYCTKRLREVICGGCENVLNCQRSNEVKKEVGFLNDHDSKYLGFEKKTHKMLKEKKNLTVNKSIATSEIFFNRESFHLILCQDRTVFKKQHIPFSNPVICVWKYLL